MREELKIFDCKRIEDNCMFDPGKSMYIEASAGTGKTYTIQQMAARLIKDGTEISRILLVTYTEKAAGELKTRIREKIEEVLVTKKLIEDGEKELSAEEMRKFETALSEADNLQVFTIHSFCQKMLRTHAYEASRPFEMELIDDSQVKTLISRWVREKWPELSTYQSLLSADGESPEGSGEENVIEKIEALLTNAMSKFYLDKEGKVDENVISWDEEEIKMPGEPEKVEPLTEDEEKLSTIDLGSFDGRKKSEEFVQIYNDLKKLRDCGTVTDTKENERLNKLIACLENGEKYGSKVQNRGIKNVEFKQIFERLQQFEKAVTQAKKVVTQAKKAVTQAKTAKSNQKKAEFYQFLHDQAEALYRAWGKEKVGNKVESYQDMIAAVHHVVMERDSELCKKLREMYQYAIIDEFQDTNQLQWDIFRTVFFKDADGKRVEEHSIFVVGDPKQSIYSFQGADVNVYRNAVRAIGNGRKLDTNYRSTPSVIKACNALFSGDYFDYSSAEASEKEAQDASGNGIRFEPSDWPGKKENNSKKDKENNSKKDKVNAQFDGKDVPAIWLAKSGADGEEGTVNEKEFAATAVEQIILCCSRDESHPENTRLRVFDSKDSQKRRNVKFSDFAVLARKRTEFDAIEKSLKKYGVPFVRYKDNNLFAGRECMAWMALFNAIDAEDFSSNNRRILNEVLLTDFFDCRKVLEKEGKGNKLEVIADDYFDDPLCGERIMIAQWHRLASNGRWAELQESIYRESGIERRLSDLSKLQEIAKLHQIGNYCVEYLYKERCGIEDLVRHLERLSKKGESTEDADGNLVERGSDFDAVQLMTIHASKGLEFPVVIGVGGYKGINNNVEGPFLYHEQVEGESRLKLGFGKTAKDRRQKEEIEEWRRLFYVAYTRASSIMILPQFSEWTVWPKKPLNFLRNGIGHIDSKEIKEIRKVKKDEELRELVIEILKKENEEKEIEKKESDEAVVAREAQNKRIALLQKNVAQLCLIQHSYSSLAKKVKKDETQVIPEEVYGVTVEDVDSQRYGEQSETEDRTSVSWGDVDKNPKQIVHVEDYQKGAVEFDEDYPRGTQLGNVIHEIFEKSDFERFGRDENDLDLKELTKKSFKRYGFDAEQHESWVSKTMEMVFETLNAKLPEIHGGKGTGVPFSLKELGKEAHFAEVEFMLSGNMEEKGEKKETKCKEGAYFSKGYIDLLFVRPDEDGNARYSILDWKTDNLECQTYSDPKKLKEKVDMNYAVQRVLYSYNLIQWLVRFYDKEPEEIFEEHFGGIYYAFVRGCRAETPNGIYAQTWESYEQLEESYQSVKELMFSSKPNEEDKEQK